MPYALIAALDGHNQHGSYKRFHHGIVAYLALRDGMFNEEILANPDYDEFTSELPARLSQARDFFGVLLDTPHENIRVRLFDGGENTAFELVIVFSGLFRTPENREFVLASAYLDPLFSEGDTKYETTTAVLQNQKSHVKGDLSRLGKYTRDLIRLTDSIAVEGESFVVGIRHQ